METIAIVDAVQIIVSSAFAIAESMGADSAQIEEAFQKAKAERMARRPEDLPDAEIKNP